MTWRRWQASGVLRVFCFEGGADALVNKLRGGEMGW